MKKRSALKKIALAAALSGVLCACGNAAPEPETTEPSMPVSTNQSVQQEIPVIVPRGEYELTPFVDYTLTDLPEFVGSIEECVDTEKQYVLPDGCLYGYQKASTGGAVNELALATDVDGTIFNGCGYLDRARLRSVLEIGETDYSFVTGFIPVSPGDVIRFGGNCFDPKHEGASVLHHAFYDENKQVVGQVSMLDAAADFEFLETNGDGFVTAMKLKEDAVPENMAYIRFTLLGLGGQQSIQVSGLEDVQEEAFMWVRGTEYVSSPWCAEIAATIDAVNSIELPKPDTAVSFIFASDIHLDPDPTTSHTDDIGKICAEVMRACDIPFFITGGDNSTQSTGFMPTAFEKNVQTVLDQLSPIPRKNILMALGNHDGATGSKKIDGETYYYRHQLSNEERSRVFFGWQRESNPYKHFDSDGTYFYLDDSSTKTRFIILNSFWSEWEGDETGFVSDAQHSFFEYPHFGPRQLRWFAQEALDMPPEYAAVIVTHHAPSARDFDIFKGIVDAYSGKGYYEGAYAGAEEWQATQIAVDYRNAAGEIIAVFQGHLHRDTVSEVFADVPCINVTTTGAYWAVKGDDAVERVEGTASEFAVDVVRIDRVNRIIYLTRLGAGADRVIPY